MWAFDKWLNDLWHEEATHDQFKEKWDSFFFLQYHQGEELEEAPWCCKSKEGRQKLLILMNDFVWN